MCILSRYLLHVSVAIVTLFVCDVFYWDSEPVAGDITYGSDGQLVQEEYYMVHEDQDPFFAGLSSLEVRHSSMYEAFKWLHPFMSSTDLYQTDYSTKTNPMFGHECLEQLADLGPLVKEEVRQGVCKADGSRPWSVAQLQESSWKTLIRLQTAAHRTALKKRPEMVLQMLYGHECYQSQGLWTLFCKVRYYAAALLETRRTKKMYSALSGVIASALVRHVETVQLPN